MRRTIKKIQHNLAEVRDYDVKKCIRLGENFELVFAENNDVMTLSPEELVSKRLTTSPPMVSMFDPNKTYTLYGYKWNPDEVEL